MTGITDFQKTLLLTAAGAADGATVCPADGKRAAAGLVRRGYFIALPQAEGPSRLFITHAGRAAIAPNPDAAGADVSSEPQPPVSGPPAPDPETSAKPPSKIDLLVALLRSPGGTTVEAMMAATGWQAHSVRGAISGSVKKGLGLAVASEKTQSGRHYSIGADAAAVVAGAAA